MVTEISISENFLEGYLTRATIEILPPLPCDNFHLPDSGRHVTSVHHGLSQADAKGEPGYNVVENAACTYCCQHNIFRFYSRFERKIYSSLVSQVNDAKTSSRNVTPTNRSGLRGNVWGGGNSLN